MQDENATIFQFYSIVSRHPICINICIEASWMEVYSSHEKAMEIPLGSKSKASISTMVQLSSVIRISSF